MTASMLHDTRCDEARFERDRIRRALLAARPSLAARLALGPTGALTVPLPRGRAIEVGRMRRSGIARWVVVEPLGDGARVHQLASVEDCVRIVLAALARRARGAAERRAG